MDVLGPFEEEPPTAEERVTLVFYPPAGGPSKTADLLPLLPEGFARPGVLRVESCDVARDWVEGWREHFRPSVIGAVRIRPPWEPASSVSVGASGSAMSAVPGASVTPQGLPTVDVVINPGLGFGTGLHPTTRGTLLLLQRGAEGSPRTTRRGALVEVGAGSGILAVAAAKLGWTPVIALDNDPVAVASALENVAINGLEGRIEVHEMDALEAPRGWLHGATILANMTLEPVTALLRRLFAEGVRPCRLVVSGILAGSQEEQLLHVARDCGLALGRSLHDGEWVTMELTPGPSEG
jgi:ribosomal protein L11 methyltransferase